MGDNGGPSNDCLSNSFNRSSKRTQSNAALSKCVGNAKFRVFAYVGSSNVFESQSFIGEAGGVSTDKLLLGDNDTSDGWDSLCVRRCNSLMSICGPTVNGSP